MIMPGNEQTPCAMQPTQETPSLCQKQRSHNNLSSKYPLMPQYQTLRVKATS
jgi:hypothetical protein